MQPTTEQTSDTGQVSTEVWLPRITVILDKSLARLTGPAIPRLVCFDLALAALGRAIEIAYQLDALETCVALSRLEILVRDADWEDLNWGKFRREVQAGEEEVKRLWLREIDKARTVSSSQITDKPEPPIRKKRSQEKPVEITPEPVSLAQATPSLEGLNGTFGYVKELVELGNQEFMDTYLAEAEDGLLELDNLLLNVESNPGDKQGVTKIFRILHTIKGNAGFLGLREISKLTHAMESFMDPIRSGEARLDDTALDRLFKGVDVLKRMHTNLRQRVDIINSPGTELNLLPVGWQELAFSFDPKSAGI